MPPDLSIVIVSWNTRELLRGCLASLPAATAGVATEVLVVDNASRDGTPTMVQADFPDVVLIESGGNVGFAAGNNLALARARGRAILLLNPDTICPPGSLAALVDRLDRLPMAAAVGPALIDGAGAPTAAWGDEPSLRHHLIGILDPARRWLPRRWREAGLGRLASSACLTQGSPDPATGAYVVDYVKGACLLMRAEALSRVGPFDDGFFLYFEETDWCRRARTANWRVYLCPDVMVVHLEGKAAGQVSDFSLRQFQTSYRRYLAKHHGPGVVPAYRLAQVVEYGGKALARTLAAGDRQQNRALARAHWTRAKLQFVSRLRAAPPASASRS